MNSRRTLATDIARIIYYYYCACRSPDIAASRCSHTCAADLRRTNKKKSNCCTCSGNFLNCNVSTDMHESINAKLPGASTESRVTPKTCNVDIKKNNPCTCMCTSRSRQIQCISRGLHCNTGATNYKEVVAAADVVPCLALPSVSVVCLCT